MATSVWWVCHKCGKAVVRKGAKRVLETMLEHRKVCAKRVLETMLEHRKVCDKLACFSLKSRRIEQ